MVRVAKAEPDFSPDSDEIDDGDGLPDDRDPGSEAEQTDSGGNAADDSEGPAESAAEDDAGNMLSQFSRETGYSLSPAAFGQLASMHLEPRHLIPVLRHGSVAAKYAANVADIREAPGAMTLRLDSESMADLLRKGVVEPEESRKVAGIALRVDDDLVVQSVMRASHPPFPNVGDVMDCTVRHVSGPRVFVTSDDGFDGILNEIEFSYVPVKNVYDHLRQGDRIRLVVWRTEPCGQIWYSFRRRFPNPWGTSPFPYVKGQTLKGMVLYHNSGGCVVELPNATTGYLGRKHEMDISGGWHELPDGQVVTVRIVQLDPTRCRIQLSAPRAASA